MSENLRQFQSFSGKHGIESRRLPHLSGYGQERGPTGLLISLQYAIFTSAITQDARHKVRRYGRIFREPDIIGYQIRPFISLDTVSLSECQSPENVQKKMCVWFQRETHLTLRVTGALIFRRGPRDRYSASATRIS